MALGKHNARARLLAGRIATALGDALVAPVLAYVPEGTINPPAAHMRFPGTITMPDAVFQSVLEYAARSFKLHGFRDIVFLGDHGGYQADETAVALRLNKEWAATPVRVHALLAYYQVTETAYPEALRRLGHGEAEIGIHAGLADTSLTLALAPDLVRSAAMAAAPAPTAKDGVSGDPRGASATLGQIGVDLILDRTVAAIRKAEARP